MERNTIHPLYFFIVVIRTSEKFLISTCQEPVSYLNMALKKGASFCKLFFCRAFAYLLF